MGCYRIAVALALLLSVKVAPELVLLEANGVGDSNVRQLASFAQRVDGRSADAKERGDVAHGEEASSTAAHKPQVRRWLRGQGRDKPLGKACDRL
jgi:hypothetical protein